VLKLLWVLRTKRLGWLTAMSGKVELDYKDPVTRVRSRRLKGGDDDNEDPEYRV
jgi:hypothetical protein